MFTCRLAAVALLLLSGVMTSACAISDRPAPEATAATNAPTNPRELLSTLRREVNASLPTCILPERADFVRESDLAELMSLVDSKEPCANVTSQLSSFLDVRRSTIGHEAALLVEGYRRGTYPFFLNSTTTDVNIQELREWWRAHTGNAHNTAPTLPSRRTI